MISITKLDYAYDDRQDIFGLFIAQIISQPMWENQFCVAMKFPIETVIMNG